MKCRVSDATKPRVSRVAQTSNPRISLFWWTRALPPPPLSPVLSLEYSADWDMVPDSVSTGEEWANTGDNTGEAGIDDVEWAWPPPLVFWLARRQTSECVKLPVWWLCVLWVSVFLFRVSQQMSKRSAVVYFPLKHGWCAIWNISRLGRDRPTYSLSTGGKQVSQSL